MLTYVGVVAVTLVAVAALLYHRGIQGQLVAERARYADLFTKILISEEGRVRAQQELDFLKQTVIQMMQRPVQAVLDDGQVALVTKALTEYWSSVYHKN